MAYSRNGSEDSMTFVDLTESPPSPVLMDRKRKRPPTLTKKPSFQWVTSAFDGFSSDFNDIPSTSQQKAVIKSSRKNFQSLSSCSSSSETKQELLSDKNMSESSRGRKKGQEGSTRCKFGKKRPTYETDLWSDKYMPTSQADLAVHKKKVNDVEGWIKSVLFSNKKMPTILLLTGQAGTGKSTTVRVLAKELGCEIQEWTNPIGQVYQKREDNFLADLSSFDWNPVPFESQMSQFQQFLLRSNKYNALGIFGEASASKKIILVEEYPNIFFRDAASFHEILKKYTHVGRCPLIFIVSDSSNDASNERLLFPKNVQSDVQIANVSFNPIAMASLTKVLTRIATEESTKGAHQFTVPSRAVMESIAMSSAGDIRAAVNALQFACLKDTKDLDQACSQSRAKKMVSKRSKKPTGKSGKSSKEKSSNGDELAAIGGRDTSLFLFRALGKILYCKRDNPSQHEDLPELPPHLKEHGRDPLLVSPEDVVEKSHLSGEYFVSYLHQNYIEFFADIDDLVRASEYLSDSDFLTVDWVSRSTLVQYSSSVATRGLMHSNTGRSRASEGGSGLGWKPLHKPQWYSVRKQQRENLENSRYMFKAYHWTPEIMSTEIIPYVNLTNITLHDAGQVRFVQEMNRFSKFVKNSEKLGEDDVDVSDYANEDTKSCVMKPLPEDGGDAMISDSQSKVQDSQEEEDEAEFLIEDYDD